MRDFRLTITKIVIVLALMGYVVVFGYALSTDAGIPIAFLLVSVLVLDIIIFLACICIYKIQVRAKVRGNSV